MIKGHTFLLLATLFEGWPKKAKPLTLNNTFDVFPKQKNLKSGQRGKKATFLSILLATFSFDYTTLKSVTFALLLVTL